MPIGIPCEIHLTSGGSVTWIFLGIIVGSVGYLMMVIFAFIEDHREARAKIEQTEIDIKRLEKQLKESEKSRHEAENRANDLQAEALQLEQDISDLRLKISSAIPSDESAPARS